MGLSSNQARFLSLTARQVDMEQRIQQICQRRLRLSSELENVATQYNNSISNRKMFLANQTNQGINNLSVSALNKLGYTVINSISKKPIQNTGLLDYVSSPDPTANYINSEQDFINLINTINAGGTPAADARAANYVLNCDLDLSDNGTFNRAVITGTFSGTFDGQGHTISGVNINVDPVQQYTGFFAKNSGTIKNLSLENVNVSSSSNWTGPPIHYSYIGTVAGQNSGTISNTSVTESSINLAGDNYGLIGGFVGQNTAQINTSYSTTDVKAGASSVYVGGFVGDTGEMASFSSCYSTGNVTVGNNSIMIAGFKGGYDDAGIPGYGSTINNCYSSGTVTAGLNSDRVGGFVSESRSTDTVINSSYTTSDVIAGAGSTNVGGFVGMYMAGTVAPTNYYQNNMTTDAAGSSATTNPISATATWDKTNVWDFSNPTPVLRNKNAQDASANLEEGLRSGKFSLAREADEFSQDPFDINGAMYQEVDWRQTPEIYDELYKGDDVDAEDKYDKIVSEINAQDKKLQLEQTSIEVEYKAVSSEREAVKKILDTNAQASFKYFS